MMALDTIKSELARLQQLIGRWDTAPEISDIERELALDKLKRIYEEVMYVERDLPQECGCAPCGEDCAAGQPAASPGSPPEPAPQPEPVREPEQEPLPAPVREPAPAPEPDPARRVGPQPGPDGEPVAEPAREPVSTPGPETDPQPDFGGKSAPVALEVIETNLFEPDSDPVPRHTLNRRVILSLYGDQPASCAETAAADRDVQAAGEAPMQAPPVCKPEPAPMPEERPAMQRRTITSQPAAQKQVLGEVIGNGAERLGDALSKQPLPEDMASRLASARTQSLRGAIGINDKFLIVAELFANDHSAYERALDDLERFTDLDELLVHIHDTYPWNPNGPGAQTLMEILTRKLS